MSGSRDDEHDARKIVLARRARFLAAAIAGVGVACSDPKHPPMPCLEPMADPDAGMDAGGAEPQVCLSVAEPEPQPCLQPLPPPDAGAPDSAPVAADPTPPPTTTAKPKKPPHPKPQVADPMPCLSVAPKQPPRKR